jgi:hypothetical protein
MTKPIHPITFIEKLVKKNELGQPFTLIDDQRKFYGRPSTSTKAGAYRGIQSVTAALKKR